MNPVTHTRLPNMYGVSGVSSNRITACFFPDTNALSKGEKPQHVYSVMFTARELWGPSAPEKDKVYIDLWDDYIDPA